MKAQPFLLRGAARELQERTDKEIILSGPAGSGKTLGCLWKIHNYAKRYPYSRHLIIRKTRASLTESALQTYERYILGEDNPMVQGVQRRNRQKYIYPNKSEIVIGGLDNATRIMSTEFDFIYVQEAIELEEDDWERLGTRNRNNVVPYQQLFGDTNPDKPTHWLKQRCDVGKTVMLYSQHEDNPSLYDVVSKTWTARGRDYLDRLENLSGPRYHRLRHGKWVQAEGLVYNEWNQSVHMVDKFRIPDDWPKYRATDFGFIHPFVTLWGAVDPDGRLYIYRQWVMTHRTVSDHAKVIGELSKGESIVLTTCDHDAEDMATLEAAGIKTTPAIKAVSPGIQTVQERLRLAGDGKPRLFVMRDSLVEVDPVLAEAKFPISLEQEMDGYVWAKGDRKDEPVKIHDDAVDCLRYLVMAVEESDVESYGEISVSKSYSIGDY